MIHVGGRGWIGNRDQGVIRGPTVVTWETKGRCHPHQKPVWIFQRLLQKLPDAKVIVDPFAGSSPCAIACHRLGKQCIAIESEGHYCEIAAERIREAFARMKAV